MLRKFLKYHLPVTLYLIIIFIFSSIPGDDLPELTFTISDKIIHGLIYLIAFYLFYFSLSHLSKNNIIKNKALIFSLLFATVYGLLDELHQSFVPNRDADILDFLSDFTGALIGFIVIFLFLRFRLKKVII
ncbi:MAG: VanZ family protein [Ignavibacteria bacterium]|nr:VanZ family protein [Ignavibacteria bacterium]